MDVSFCIRLRKGNRLDAETGLRSSKANGGTGKGSCTAISNAYAVMVLIFLYSLALTPV